jgi:Peptidase A4 family
MTRPSIAHDASLSWWRVCYACLALVLALLTVSADKTLAAASTTSCPANYNANTASDATLQACGDTYYPLVNATPLAGGGLSYNYDGEGLEVSYLVPSASFNPATASSAELKAYGLEAPSTSSLEWPMWNTMIHNMHFQGTPPSRLVFLHKGISSPAVRLNSSTNSATGSANWSGYGDYASTQAYNRAAAYFVQPNPIATCFDAQISIWAGLGGWYSGNLAQNGTADGESGLEDHGGWWEILPANPVPVPEHGTPGYYFETQTHYEGYSESRNHFNFYFYDYAEGSWWSVNVKTTYGVDRSTAEYIVERPTIERSSKRYMLPLESYSNIDMQGFTEGNGLASYPYNSITMNEKNPPNTILATVAGIPPSSYLFTNTFQNCGREEEF